MSDKALSIIAGVSLLVLFAAQVFRLSPRTMIALLTAQLVVFVVSFVRWRFF